MSCLITLRKGGFKLTPQRRAVIEILNKVHRHLSADEIIDFVQSKMPGVNRSTVYRSLKLLEEQGCVLRSEIGGRYIYHHADEGHHHHLLCSNCGKIIDCGEDLFFPIQEAIKERYGFKADFKHMIINGLCRECGKK